MQNVEQTIISQFANSPTLVQLIQDMDAYIDPSADIQTFYDYCWNVETAQGFGLDIWGRIVGVSRLLQVPFLPEQFGFETATVAAAALGVFVLDETHLDDTSPAGPAPGLSSAAPFNQAPFNSGIASTQTYSLTDDAYRTLILVKALANISDTAVRSFNQLLQNLFADRGRCYVVDHGQMTMWYVFEFALEPYEVAIILNSGVFPRPAGVQAYAYQLSAADTFAFNGGTGQPFGQGVFDSMSNLQPTS